MELSKQVATTEQSKKLMELGIKQGTTHFAYRYTSLGFKLFTRDDEEDYDYDAPTVAELGEMLTVYQDNVAEAYFNPYSKCWHYQIVKHNTFLEIRSSVGNFNSEAEARADMLIFMIKANFLTPEEVNTRLQQL